MIDNVDINKKLISNKVFLAKKGYKHFIGYKHSDYKVKPLCTILPKMSVYVKHFDKTKSVFFG